MKAFTVRIAEPEYEALQALYYATIKVHRSSFNAWICKLIAEGMTSAWYAADCPVTRPAVRYPKHCVKCGAGLPVPYLADDEDELCARCAPLG
jgi:hypothetical protein